MLLTKSLAISMAFVTLLVCSQGAFAQVLPEATVGIKIALVKKPTTRPMTIAYVPYVKRYYIADGGLGPLPGDRRGVHAVCRHGIQELVADTHDRVQHVHRRLEDHRDLGQAEMKARRRKR